MPTSHRLVLSQNFSCLARRLAEDISVRKDRLLQKKWILVPYQALKEWLSLQLAVCLPSQGLIGYRIVSLDAFTQMSSSCFPSPTEMVSLIDRALKETSDPEIDVFVGKDVKKRTDLSFQLSSLFFEYGKYSISQKEGFQMKLFSSLWKENGFCFPLDVWVKEIERDDPIYCFGFDFLPPLAWHFLERHSEAFFYSFSPCMHYWGDVSTDRERKSLSSFWKKKKGSLAVWQQIESSFLEEPPLLANWGKLGKETLKIWDDFPFEIEESYDLEFKEPDSLLSRMQRDILFFEVSDFSCLQKDDSICVFRAGSSLLKEVETVYLEILSLNEKKGIAFSEIAILAPDIEPYIPLIEYVFSFVPYRFLSLSLSRKSSFYQGLGCLFSLAQKKWTCDELTFLFENRSFARQQKWDEKTKEKMIFFLREIFSLSSDWKEGICLFIHETMTLSLGKKTSGLVLSEIVYFEEFFVLLQSLYEDLHSLALKSQNWMNWSLSIEALQKKYLSPDLSTQEESRAFSCFCDQLKEWKEAFFSLKEDEYSLDFVWRLLQKPSFGSMNGNHLHAVRIGSMAEGCITPATALFLLGMDEDAFPKKSKASSMNLLKKESFYIPDASDRDRYVFLQALMNVSSYLRISYRHLSLDDGSEIAPSFVVQDLLQVMGASLSQSLCRVVEKKEILPLVMTERRFSLQVPEEKKISQDLILSLSDLVFFARHPWKYYLQRVERLFLKDRSPSSFMMKRSSVLRSSFHMPFDAVLEETLDEAFGLFKEAFSIDVKDKYNERLDLLKKWGQEIQKISFLETSLESRESLDFLELPSIEWECEEGFRIRIVGDVPYALKEGALYLGDDTLASFLKSWPEILAVLAGLNKTNVYCLKAGKIKQIENPLEDLKKFVSYYLRTSESLSVLTFDWADFVLRKIDSEPPFEGIYEDVYVEWILKRLDMPSFSSLQKEWSWLRDVFSGLIALYSKDVRSHATV